MKFLSFKKIYRVRQKNRQHFKHQHLTETRCMRSEKEIHCYKGHTKRLFTLKKYVISFTKINYFVMKTILSKLKAACFMAKKSLRSNKKLLQEE